MTLLNMDLLDNIIMQSRIDDLLPFLKKVDKKEYPALKKQIFSLFKQLNSQWSHNDKGQYTIEMNETQRDMFLLGGLVLCNFKEFTKTFPYFFLLRNYKHERLFDFLELGKPDWFFKIFDPFTDYLHLKKLYENGYIPHVPELFIQSLIINLNRNLGQVELENIVVNDVHIYTIDLPAIFEYQTAIGHSGFINELDINTRKINKTQKNIWHEVIKKLTEQGKWDKHETLLKCLECLKKNWNRNMLNWYKGLFLDLAITNEDILKCQNELFYLIPMQNSGTVAFAVDVLNRISDHKDFDTNSFVEFTNTVLHRTDCKGVIKIIISICEKIIKRNPSQCQDICVNLCNVLLIDDLSLQEKAVKIISKYGYAHFEKLITNLKELESFIKGDLKKQLAKFLEISNSIVNFDLIKKYTMIPQEVKRIKEDSLLVILDNCTDLLFQIGKVLSEENFVIDVEIFLQTFEKLHNAFPNDFNLQLSPYKKQATGWADSISKQIFYAFIQHWASENSSKRFIYFHEYSKPDANLRLFAHRFTQLYDKKLKKSDAPILCAITHAPYWIHPQIFVERLLWYTQNDIQPDNWDLCTAICRVAYEEYETALELAKDLNEKHRDLVYYMFDKKELLEIKTIKSDFKNLPNQNGEIENSNIFAVLAARSKNPVGIFNEFRGISYAQYANVIEPHPLKWSIGDNVKSIYLPASMIKDVSFEKFSFEMREFKCVVGNYNDNFPELIYSKSINTNQHGSEQRIYSKDFDIYLSYVPNYNTPLYVQIVNTYSRNDIDNSVATFALKRYLDGSFALEAVHYLFLSVMFFNNKKEHRALASEVLIHHIGIQSIDVELWAKNMGELSKQGYGSLNRPLAVLSTLKDVSPIHNIALKEIYETLFLTIFDEKEIPQNAKKLLEDYFDVLIKTETTPSVFLQNQVVKWSDNANLKKIVGAIIKRGKVI